MTVGYKTSLETSGEITEYKTETLTDTRSFSTCVTMTKAYTGLWQSWLCECGSGKSQKCTWMDLGCPSGSQAERVPCPHPDAMLGYKLFSQELLPAGEEQTQRQLRNFQPGPCPYKLGSGKHCSRHMVVLQFMTHKHFKVSDRSLSQFMGSTS